MANRQLTLPGIWAESAVTTIPPSPVKGTTYRDETVDEPVVDNAWPFDSIVDSSQTNQFLYLMSSLVKQMEANGVLKYSPYIDYSASEGAVVTGSDGNLYRCLENNGPSTIAIDPVGSPPYWELISGFSPASTKERGITLSNAVADVDKQISIAPGLVASSDYSTLIKLTSTLTKKINTAWATGTSNGGLPSSLSLTPDTWYHVFVISDAKGLNVDAGFDTSINATNLLADSGLTKYRRIGSVKTNSSSNVLQFVQVGRSFVYKNRIVDLSNGTGSGVLSLSVPSSVNVVADMNLGIYKQGNYSRADIYQIGTTAPTDTRDGSTISTGSGQGFEWAQVTYKTEFVVGSTASVNYIVWEGDLTVTTLGWKDQTLTWL